MRLGRFDSHPIVYQVSRSHFEHQTMQLMMRAVDVQQPLPYLRGCLYSDIISPAVVLAEKMCLIIGDLIVVAVTWWKTYGILRQAYKTQIKAPLYQAIFRDG